MTRKLYIASATAIMLAITIPLTTSAIKNIFNTSTQVSYIQTGTTRIKEVFLGEELIWDRYTISDLTYLQDLALPEYQTACANTADRIRTTLIDRRNGQPYYVEKINASGSDLSTGDPLDLCWMETNLRYSGNGDWESFWGYPDDRRTLTLVPVLATNTANSAPEYADYSQGITDHTTPGPGAPGAPAFYGYLYNWCAAMGGQPNTCDASTDTGHDLSISLCPSGWRLPSRGIDERLSSQGNDFTALNNAVNNGNGASDTGILENWLGVYSGLGTATGVSLQGIGGNYWSSTPESYDDGSLVRSFAIVGGSLVDHRASTQYRHYGASIRCVIGDPQ